MEEIFKKKEKYTRIAIEQDLVDKLRLLNLGSLNNTIKELLKRPAVKFGPSIDKTSQIENKLKENSQAIFEIQAVLERLVQLNHLKTI